MKFGLGAVAAMLAGQPTDWRNLGYWSPARTEPGHGHTEPQYETACAALAGWLAQAGSLRAGAKILDLAAGAGASCRYWLEKHAASSVWAVERDHEAAERLRQGASPERLQVIVGDVMDEAIEQEWRAGSFDAVLCLDAYYHFRGPQRLWQLAATALRPGGTLAFTALLARPGRSLSALHQGLLWAADVHLGGVMTPGVLAEGLAVYGLGDFRSQVGSREVLGGFRRFVRFRARQLSFRQCLQPAWLQAEATAALAGSLLEAEAIDYVAVSAVKQGG